MHSFKSCLLEGPGQTYTSIAYIEGLHALSIYDYHSVTPSFHRLKNRNSP